MCKRLGVILILWLVLVISSCAPKELAQEPDRVTLQLKWVHQAQFAGYYVALEKGFYTDENIELEILPGGMGVDPFGVLISGQADFAVVAPEGIFLQRAAGDNVVAIATIYQRNPFLLITLADSGLKTPYDFPGHIIAIGNSASDVPYRAMLNHVDINPEMITEVDFNFDYQPFYDGDVDIMPAFAAGSLLNIVRDGVEVNKIWPGDFGVHWYSDTIAARGDFLASEPELTLRFLRATLKGHQYAIANPDEAVDISLIYADVQDLAVQQDMLDAAIPMIHTGSTPVGWMDADIWEGMRQDLVDQELIEPFVLSTGAYTLEFIEKIYGNH